MIHVDLYYFVKRNKTKENQARYSKTKGIMQTYFVIR